jgi:hypothetical protein
MMTQAARPRRGWLFAGVPVAVLLLSCFGAAGGSFVARQEIAAASPSPSPAAVRSASPQPTIVVRLPNTLLGRAKAKEKALVQSAEQAVTAQRTAEIGAESVQAAYYGGVNRSNLLFVLAVQAKSSDPEQTYGRVVAALEEQQSGLKVAALDPGPLGRPGGVRRSAGVRPPGHLLRLGGLRLLRVRRVLRCPRRTAARAVHQGPRPDRIRLLALDRHRVALADPAALENLGVDACAGLGRTPRQGRDPVVRSQYAQRIGVARQVAVGQRRYRA